MKKRVLHHIGFAGKSLMWSMLFYTILMICINWDDVSTGFKKYKNENLVSNITATISPQTVTDAPTSKNDNSQKHSTVFAAIKTVVDLFGKIISFKTR